MKLSSVDYYLDWPVSIKLKNLRKFIIANLEKKGDLILIMGGPMGVKDIGSDSYPWLKLERDFIKKELENEGIKSIAIMSNDPSRYEEDSFDNMIKFSKNNDFNFPYLIDETQEVAKTYGAVCTPDFFGYNKDLELQYRGRIRELKNLKPIESGDSELKNAMKMIAKTNNGPNEQFPSMGCSIKWF